VRTIWVLALALLGVPSASVDPPAERAAGGAAAPVHPVVVLSEFDPPAQPWLPGHRGADLRAASGDPVRAARAGRVTFAADLAGRGVVVVDHGELRSTYEPVEATVTVGDPVRSGQAIGTIATGTGHCGDGHCLHLGLRRDRQYLDPLLLLGPGTPRLRPW
jgi:murein DD-endopeptidase MepM/ murein hydrolase activator NlpD